MIFEKLIYYFFDFLPNKLPHILFEFLSGFIPILFAIFYSKYFYFKKKILLIYAIFIIVFELINNIYSAFSLNNHDIYLISYIIETGILLFYFNNEINEKMYSYVCSTLFILISMFLIINIFSEVDLMNDLSSSFQSLVLILLTLINYYYLLFKFKINNLKNYTFFWINTATFLYFAGKFFVSLYLLEIFGNINNDDLLNYWGIVSIFLIINRILISVGISKLKYEKSI